MSDWQPARIRSIDLACPSLSSTFNEEDKEYARSKVGAVVHVRPMEATSKRCGCPIFAVKPEDHVPGKGMWLALCQIDTD